MTYEIDPDSWRLRRIEVPAREIIDHGFGRGYSLLEPEVPAWGAEAAADLRRRMVDEADLGTGTFLDKLRTQLSGASVATHLLAVELLALHSLPLGNIGGRRKLERVTTVLSWLDSPVELPDELRDALNGPGMFHGGVGFNVQIWQQLGWLLRLIEHWNQLSEQERRTALQDPWQFRDIADYTETGQLAIRNSLLYLAFPETFLPVVSQPDKRKIRDSFADAIRGSTGSDMSSIERDLSAIHRELEEQVGGPVTFYHEPWISRWQKPSTSSGAARAWLVRPKAGGRDIVDRWRREGTVSVAAQHLGGIAAEISRDELSKAVQDGYRHEDYTQRLTWANEFHSFLALMKPGDLVATVMDHDVYGGTIDGEAEVTEESQARLQRAVDWSTKTLGTVDELGRPLTTELEHQGTVVDITAAADMLTKLIAPGPINGGGPSPAETHLPRVTPELAERLHIDESWLREFVDVLEDRQQVVLYGPPGTGKTYLARKICQHLTDSDAVRLVQFHPSYAYEDFFEGFRPAAHDDGVGFTLTPGPLRQLAAAARADPARPYALIIDEINRANLAKVFGELYFLLEYRDDSILLQYSPNEAFTLPRNLYFIGTMNTADRSIALVDTAMRRRFAFLELHPDEPPIDKLLTRWTRANGKSDERAQLLDALNAEISTADRDFKIGPSYLMKPDADREGGLQRVWRHSILPLLEEHYFGRLTRDEVHARFGLATVRQNVQRDQE